MGKNTYGLDMAKNLGEWYPVRGLAVVKRGDKFVVVDDDDRAIWKFSRHQNKFIMEKIKDNWAPAIVYVDEECVKIVLENDYVYIWKGGAITEGI